jgi:hypothetical protein
LGDEAMNLREGVRDLLALIDQHVASLESPPEQAPREFAAAGLMRCCSLLSGICVLEDAGLAAVEAILERQHWETWLVSLYVLLRGQEALGEVAGDDIFWKRVLSEKLNLGFAYHENWEGKPAKLNFKKLYHDLQLLLEIAGEPASPGGAQGYDVTYRVQSQFAVHAGLATIGSYLRYGEKTWTVVRNPGPLFPRVSQTPALHTAHLARYVFKSFGLPIEELEPICDTLINMKCDSDSHVRARAVADRRDSQSE